MTNVQQTTLLISTKAHKKTDLPEKNNSTWSQYTLRYLLLQNNVFFYRSQLYQIKIYVFGFLLINYFFIFCVFVSSSVEIIE